MKLSDYVIKFLEDYGVTDMFLLSGGGIMHLLDSVNSSKKISKYYNLNEQATSFCADSYAQASGKLGVCMVTTGPGATNAITGVASGHIDSSPMLIISGQVRTNTMIGDSGARQIGAQEVNIVPIVKPITKYAVTVMDANLIRYHLEKAVYLATHERPGAVWIDIPLNIQAQQIDPEKLEGFTPPHSQQNIDTGKTQQFFELLAESKRPVILAGSGVFFSGAVENLIEFAKIINIPVLSTQKLRRIAADLPKEMYFGSPGIPAARYANYVLQNSDLLIVIGCGLRYYITAFDEEHFAPYAKKVIINIDETEINKLKMPLHLSLCADAKLVLSELTNAAKNYQMPDIQKWWAYCKNIKEKYPVNKDIEHTEVPDYWAVADSCIKRLRSDDIITTVSSNNCILPFYCHYEPCQNQKLIQMIGLGSMGHGVPAVIATCIAFGKKRTIMFEGDGSLQHNIQELALIKTHNLPIKLFIDNNSGYGQIYGMQQNHFSGRLAGCNPESGVNFPNLEKIAYAYGIDYVSIKSSQEIDEKIEDVLKDDRPVICEFFTEIDFPAYFVTKSRVLPDGQMTSSVLEDLYPFLPADEHKANMIAL